MTLPIGKVCCFAQGTLHDDNTRTAFVVINDVAPDLIPLLGAPVGEDRYHIVMMKHGSDLSRLSKVTMNQIATFIDPIEYVKNLIAQGMVVMGFIMPATENSQTIFDSLVEDLLNICEWSNHAKAEANAAIEASRDNASKSLHRAQLHLVPQS